jgi:hypothetical protein
MSFNAVSFFGSGEMPSFEYVTPKNTTLSLLNSHYSRLAKNFSDDIIIYGKSQIEHDRELDNIVKRLLENGLALNLE